MNRAEDLQLPPGIERKPPGRKVVGPLLPAVHANDIKIEATPDEVVVTFALLSRGQGDDQIAQQTAKVALSWTGLELLAGNSLELLSEAADYRIQALSAQLAQVRKFAESAPVDQSAQSG